MIGICAEGADAMAGSWQAHRAIERPEVNTIADGIAVRRPVPEALTDMEGLVDEVLLVSDAAILYAMRMLFQSAGLVVEPAGAAGISALVEHPALGTQRVASVLCGSNLTAEQMARWIY